MTKTNLNEKPHFPYTYGDLIEANETRVSNHVINLVQNEKFQNHCISVASALVTLSFYATPASAIPPEYGEAVNGIVNNMDPVVPPVGAGTINAQQNVLPKGVGEPGRVNLYGQNGHLPINGQNPIGVPQKPIQPPACKLPGPPLSSAGQYTNTVFLIGSVGWICLNASWGNPVFAYGCVGIVGGLVNELRKRCLS